MYTKKVGLDSLPAATPANCFVLPLNAWPEKINNFPLAENHFLASLFLTFIFVFQEKAEADIVQRRDQDKKGM